MFHSGAKRHWWGLAP